MKTQSNSPTPKFNPLNAWDRPWTRLQIGYYVAVFILLSILLGVAHPIQSLPFNLLLAALWPGTTILAALVGLGCGQPLALLIPVACYAPYFIVADICATLNPKKPRIENPAKNP